MTLNWNKALFCAPGLALLLAGCGGGGGSSSTPTPSPVLGPLLVTGAVQQTPAGSAQSGYVVTFDGNPKLTATTDANGAFTLSVPRASVTGKDSLSVSNPGGMLVDALPVPANTMTLGSYDTGTLNVSPPGAPAGGV